MERRPSEIFGYSYNNGSRKATSARKKYWCDFTNKKCDKKSRLIDYPMGVCSVVYNEKVIALCPKRFLQNKKAFKDIAESYFQSTNDLIVFPEVRINPVGQFDYVMVQHEQMSDEIKDFVVIEFQTGQTTNTGKLVTGLKDFVSGKEIGEGSYSFGINFYDIWKRSFTQILSKGIIMESWNKKIYWVVQDFILEDLVKRYHLGNMDYREEDSTVFSTYDLIESDKEIDLVHHKLRSATVDSLFKAFRHNPDIPKLEDFENQLERKMKKPQIGFSLI